MSFMTKIKSKKNLFSDEDIFKFDSLGWLDNSPDKPQWKYKKVRAPQSLVILDDILGSQVVHSPYFTKVATLNRHIAGLKEPYGERTACGFGVMFNSQTYSMAQGVSRVLRENLTNMIIFKNKQQKQTGQDDRRAGWFSRCRKIHGSIQLCNTRQTRFVAR